MESQRRVAGKPGTFVHQKNIPVSDDGTKVTVKAAETNVGLRANCIQFRGGVLRPDRRCYTIKIDRIDSMNYVMFGLTRYCWPRSPCWDISHAIRYHSNDGGIFNGGASQRSHVTFNAGDTVVCRAAYLGRNRCVVEFIKNDRYIFRQWAHLPATELYATLGFAQTTATLAVDWPAASKPDIDLAVNRLSNWIALAAIERDDVSKVAKVTQPITSDSKALCMLAPKPFDPGFNYFEVEITELSADETSAIAIGVVPPIFTRTDFPGWKSYSIGYHGDDGGLHKDGEQVSQDDANKCKQGDVIGCGVVFSDVKNVDTEQQAMVVVVFFTKNGSLVYEKTVRQPCGGSYPCVAFMGHNSSVKINTKAKCNFSTQHMQWALKKLDTDRDLIHSQNAKITDVGDWKCSVEPTTEGSCFVQMKSWPLEEEQQLFMVSPLKIPEKLGDQCEILVGVANKMTSTDDQPTWLCSYNMTSGQIFSADGLKVTLKHKVGDGAVACMVDHNKEDQVIVKFFTSKRVLGRAMFRKADANTSICATLAITGAGVLSKVNWTGVLFPFGYLDPKEADLSLWPSGDEQLITVVADDPKSMTGTTTSLQSPSYFGMSLPYVEFSVTKTHGQCPVIGLSTAWSDLHSLIGGQVGEISLDPMTGDIISNNEIVDRIELDTKASEQESVGVGVVFTKQDVREPQSVVIYFTLSNRPIYQRVFDTALGGVYPTVTFPSQGCQITLKKGVYPLLPDTMITAWLENIETNKQKQDNNQVSSGTFSAFTKKFAVNAADNTRVVSEHKATAEGQNKAGVVVKDSGKIVERGKISFTADGEARVVANDNGKEMLRKVEASEKSTEISAEADTVDKKSEGDETKSSGEEGKEKESTANSSNAVQSEKAVADKPEQSEKPEAQNTDGLSNEVAANASTSNVKPNSNQTESKPTVTDKNKEVETTKPTEGETTKPTEGETTKPTEGETTKPTEGETTKPTEGETTKPTEGETTKPTEGETTKPSQADAKILSSDADKAKIEKILLPAEFLRHQSMHPGSNIHDTNLSSDSDTHKTERIAMPAEFGGQEFIAHQSMHAGDNTHYMVGWAKERDQHREKDEPGLLDQKDPTDQKEDKNTSSGPEKPAPATMPPGSSSLGTLSPSTSSSSSLPQPLSSTQEKPDDPDSKTRGEENRGGAFYVQERYDLFPVSNLLLDPSVVYHERKLRNEQHIKSLSESEAKDVLKNINKDMPEKLTTYLSQFDMKLSTPAASKSDANVSQSTEPSSDSAMTATSSSSTSQRSARASIRRLNTASKACCLS